MAAAELQRAPVTCPRCGHTQLEPLAVISTVCRRCQGAIQIRKDIASPRATSRPAGSIATSRPEVESRQLECFTCGTLLTVPATAESTMCKRCSSHIDLRDYSINQAVSKNFRTHGRFVVREKGYVFNTDSLVGAAVIKGRFHGKLHARHSLEIHTGAEIKGSITAGLLIIPAGQVFAWSSPLEVISAEVAGELCSSLHASGSVWVRGSGRVFGDVHARAVEVEPGGVLVGLLRVTPGEAGRGAGL